MLLTACAQVCAADARTSGSERSARGDGRASERSARGDGRADRRMRSHRCLSGLHQLLREEGTLLNVGVEPTAHTAEDRRRALLYFFSAPVTHTSIYRAGTCSSRSLITHEFINE